MNKSEKNIRDDEMWCPECGAPIKKGFFTCANCKLKVELTKDINKNQTKKKKSKSAEPKENTVKKKSKEKTVKSKGKTETPESVIKDKEKKEVLKDIFEEDTTKKDIKKRGAHPGWWNYG